MALSRPYCLAALFLPVLLAGCASGPLAPATVSAAVSLQGKLHGGQQAVSGAHVYLFAAATTGYGQPSVSLLKSASTGLSDSIGAYVLTGSDGSFSINNDYTCTANTQVYLYALGGNPGAGANPAAGFLAVLGNCPSTQNFSNATPFIWVNEVSTVAAAYAMSGYATDATHVASSGTTLAQKGIANAFLNAANLASLNTGVALTTTPAGNGTVPQTEINTLANILASCVNSTGSCATLFSNAQNNGTSPTDTATAAINIAHNPGTSVSTLYNLSFGVSSPFAPALSRVPNDFSLALTFTGGGLAGPNAIAVDASGNIWVANYVRVGGGGGGSFSELASTGAAISPAAGYFDPLYGNVPQAIAVDTAGNAWLAYGRTVGKYSTGGVYSEVTPASSGGPQDGRGIALDKSGNVWLVDDWDNAVFEYTSAETPITSTSGITVGSSPWAVAIDPSGFVWIANRVGNTLTKLSSTGTPISAATGYTGGGMSGPASVAVDHSGNVWIANAGGGNSEFSSSGTVLSPSGGYPNTYNRTGGSLGIAIDGLGNVWTVTDSSICETLPTGSAVGCFSPGTIGSQYPAITIDGSGSVWVTLSSNSSPITSITEFVGAAAPVVTPLQAGVINNTLGTRP